MQPLATLLYVIPYWLTAGDKVASLVGVILIMAAWSVGAAWAIQRFARGVLAPQSEAPVWSWLVAALWFIGPLVLLHSMNGLETGLYIGMVAATMAFFGHLSVRGGLYTRARPADPAAASAGSPSSRGSTVRCSSPRSSACASSTCSGRARAPSARR